LEQLKDTKSINHEGGREIDYQRLTVMQYQNSKTRFSRALTLVEMLIAMSIMAIVFAAILPQFRAIQNSWASKQAAAETLQNGRVLTEHLYRNLSKAVKITAVSDSSETNGYIEFEDNDENILRYDIAASNYVEFGPVGDLYELAGPVSQLLFTCYDDSNFDTPTTNVNSIRFVKVEAILTNSSPMGRDITLETSTYLRTNVSCLVGWWKLDESSGLTAADSSVFGNDGTLTNMAGDEWTTGIVGGALAFDGIDDYIDCGDDDSLNIRNEITMSAWVNLSARPAKNEWFDIIMKGDLTYSMYVQGADTVLTTLAAEFDLDTGYKDHWMLTSIDIPPGEWVHVAVTFDNTDCKFYVNGVLDHTENAPGTIDDNAAEDLVLVKGNGDYLEGSLDDVRIYNRAMIFEEVAGSAGILRYEEFTEAKLGSDGTSLTISTPGGVSEGSLLIAAVATDGDTTSSLAPPLGEGWTQINLNDYGSEVTLGAWWKNADALESPSHQFTWSGNRRAYGWIMRFTGHDLTDPINGSMADGEADTNPTCHSVTTIVDGCIILRLGGFDDGDITEDDPGLSGHTAITMDSSNNRAAMYWADEEVDKIQRADLDGSNIEDLVTAAIMKTKALALDVAGGKMYWADEEVDKIQRADLDGSNIEDLVTAATMKTKALALDVAGGKMYWADEEVDKIRRANLDGSNIEDLVTAATMKTGALALDVAGGKMYWADEEVDKIQRADLDGSNIEDLVTAAKMKTKALALDVAGGKMYWADEEVDKIRRADLDGSNIEDLVTAETMKTWALALALNEVGSGAVSGGAGYIKELAIGGSGTSDFALTASEESRTLTIAIAPGAGGIEVIRP